MWVQTSQTSSSLSPKRDLGSKGVKCGTRLCGNGIYTFPWHGSGISSFVRQRDFTCITGSRNYPESRIKPRDKIPRNPLIFFDLTAQELFFPTIPLWTRAPEKKKNSTQPFVLDTQTGVGILKPSENRKKKSREKTSVFRLRPVIIKTIR